MFAKSEWKKKTEWRAQTGLDDIEKGSEETTMQGEIVQLAPNSLLLPAWHVHADKHIHILICQDGSDPPVKLGHSCSVIF